MLHRHSQLIIDGRLQKAPGVPLLSSARTPWSGPLLERFSRRAGYARSILWQRTNVSLVDAGSLAIEDCALAGGQRMVAGPGSVSIWPCGHELRSVSWTGPGETLMIELETPLLQKASCGDPSRNVSLFWRVGIVDSALAALMRLMEVEVAAGSLTGSLYAESLSLALAAHVSRRYAAVPATIAAPKSGLSRHQLGRVLGYVHDNLASDLRLAELAGLLELSPYYFARAFRNSLGVSPHQYVIRERVEAAKRLLAERRMPVAEVALAVGFSSQSHLAKFFDRQTGTTPRRYLRER